mmetsp:Transcript_37197/g.83789  ORF Transcript_37197/g.83789 Transcript_37197/m.83789 type:complete len:213 (+) Transcript_37197:225-863(+)
MTLTPEDVVGVLQGRGWEATIVKQSECSDLVPVESSGYLKCVDGRGVDHTNTRGPKMLGGVYAIAHNRGLKTTDDLQDICREVSEKGYIPSVHGDGDGNMLGCGYCKLWLTGKFADLDPVKGAPPTYSADDGAAAVKAKGQVEMCKGSHAEKFVYINFVEDQTIEPNHDDQKFVVDAWAAMKFDLDVPSYLVTAAATVERLGGPKIAKLVVP